MRIKKILSLAVVLAMVLTVVPMFGLTASAAEFTYPEEIKPWGNKHTTLTFGPYSGTVTISYDIVFNLGSANSEGAHFIGLGLRSSESNIPGFGESAIALQGIDGDNKQFGFVDGKDGKADTRQGKFTPVDETVYHVSITADTAKQTYDATLKDDDSLNVSATGAEFRFISNALDTLMVYHNGSTDAAEDWCTITNFKVTGKPADIKPYETDKTEYTDKNNIPWQKAGTAAGNAKPSIVTNGSFDMGFQGWTNGANASINGSRANFELLDSVSDHANVLKIVNGGGSGSDKAIGTRWPIEGGKSYVFSVDMYREKSGHCNGGLKFLKNDGAEIQPTDDNILSSNIQVQVKNNAKQTGICENGDYLFNDFEGWTTHEFMVKAPADAKELLFNVAWADGVHIDNVSLYELERVPTEVTVNFQDADSNSELGTPETITEGLYVGDSYTYDVVDENQIKTFDQKTYIYQSGEVTINSLKKKDEGNTLTLKYKQDEPKTVTELQLKTRPGLAVELPETVDAQGASTTFKGLKVNWNDDNKDKIPTAEDLNSSYKVTGVLADYPSVTVNANVKVVSVEDYLVAYASFDDDKSHDVGTQKTVKKGSGDVTFEEGYSGKAAVFEGAKNENAAYIEVSGNGAEDKALVGLDAFTVTLYAKANANANFNANWPFYAAPNDESGDNYLAIIQNKAATTVGFERYIGSRNTAATSTSSGNNYPITPDEWTAYALVVDGAKTTLYVNGAEAATRTVENPDSKMSDLFSETSKVKIGYANWGETFNGMVDEFKIYSVALTPEEVATGTKAVKVDYQVDGTTVKSVEKRVLSDQTCDFPALVNVPYNGKYYNAAEKQGLSDSDTVDMTLVESMGESEDYVAPTSMFSYDLNNKAGIAPGGNGYEANGWNNAFIVMTFPIEVEPGKKLKSATLHTKVNKAEGNSDTATNYRVVAIDPKYVDVENATMKSYEGTGESAVGGVKVSNSSNVKTGNANPLALDLSKINDGEFLALMVGTSNRVYNAGIETADAPYLTDVVIEDAPVDVNAYLGRNEAGDLTVDFEFGELYEGTTVEITREDEQYTNNPVMSGNNVVSITPASSNIIYTATVKAAGETVVGTAKASLYSVVVNNIVNAELGYTKDKISGMVDKVNKVISDGGIFYSEALADTNNLTAETQKIMAYETDHLAINETLFNLGIGFVSDGVEIFVGNAPAEKADVTVSGTEAEAYRYLKIEDNSVKLSNDPEFAAQETVTLSLDSVNIEFVETLIEELEAEGADAAQDFIPEL